MTNTSTYVTDETLQDTLSDAISEEDSTEESINETNEHGHQLNNRRLSSTSLKLRAQKHLAGRVACAPKSLRPLIGRRASNTLKSFEQLLKLHLKSNADVRRLIKASIKIMCKLGVVIRQNTLTDEQYQLAHSLKHQFRTIALTVITFGRTDCMYDRQFLSDSILNCQLTLRRCVTDVLSENSHRRIDYVADTLRNPQLLDDIFSPQATVSQRQALATLIEHLESMVRPKTDT